MPSLNRNENTNCENCGTQTTRLNFARHKKRCSVGSFICSSRTNFSTKSRAEMNFKIAQKHSKATAMFIHNCTKYDKDFHSFHNLRERKRNEHVARRGSKAQKVDVAQVMGDVDGNSLKENLEACKHFLVDSEMVNGRHRVYNFAMDTLYPKNLLEKLDVVFDSLKCAATLNVAFGFVLKYVEDGSCKYYFAHENITLLKRSKLVATTEDLTKIKNLLSNIDINESCTRERANPKNKFYKLTNLTLFASLFKEVPVGFKDTVLPDPPLKSHSVRRLTFEEKTRKTYNGNLCLVRALALHLHGNEKFE